MSGVLGSPSVSCLVAGSRRGSSSSLGKGTRGPLCHLCSDSKPPRPPAPTALRPHLSLPSLTFRCLLQQCSQLTWGQGNMCREGTLFGPAPWTPSKAEGAEGRGHMTGTPAPSAASSPCTPLPPPPAVSSAIDRGRHFLRARGTAGEARAAQPPPPGRGSALPFARGTRAGLTGSVRGSCGCRFPVPRGPRAAVPSPESGAVSASSPQARSFPAWGATASAAGLRGRRGAGALICRLPVAPARLGGPNSDSTGGSHHIGLSYS